MKKLVKTLASASTVAIILLSGCEKNPVSEDRTKDDIVASLDDTDRIKIYQDEFASILSKTIADRDVRDFIKREALKQINLDYDVFYAFVKDKIVSGNQTFREKLLKFETISGQLDKIEDNLPLLTIYVPELPSGFSAESWNIDSEIPSVTSDKIDGGIFKFHTSNSEGFDLKSDLIPGFPTLVVKQNERIIISQNGINKIASTHAKNGTSGRDYSFKSPEFDGLSNSIGNETASQRISNKIGNISEIEKLASLWDTNPNDWDYKNFEIGAISEHDDFLLNTPSTWPRDYIYYGITANNTSGKLKPNIIEYIRELRITNEGLYKMMDQDDPKLITNNNTTTNFWTDGRFEIRFDIFVNAKNGLGTLITKYTNIAPSDLFGVRYDIITLSGNRKAYKINKLYAQNKRLNIPLIAWDLENYSTGWKITISEEDPGQQITQTQTYTSQYVTNFGISAEVDLGIVKIGGQSGGQNTSTSTNTVTTVTSQASDNLGDLTLFFSDPISLNTPAVANPHDYVQGYILKNPYVHLTVYPGRLQ